MVVDSKQTDFMVHFTVGTGGHYISMLPADWSISTSPYYSEKMLWNLSVTGSPAVAKAIGPLLGR